MASWKRNLLFLWLSQFFSITGFSLVLPFAPYFIQELGITDTDAVKLWAAMSFTAPALGLGIAAPIWGVLADRFGRKLMMLRANFSAVAVLAAMSFAPNVQVFILLRLIQGILTGTMNAAMTFVASYSPEAKQGTALGTLSTAVFSGAAAGPFVGGLLADAVGYRPTFIFSAILLLISALLILFGVREKFVKPEIDHRKSVMTLRERVGALGPGLPILLLICITSFARRFDQPILPLYIQEIHGQLDGASKWAGAVFGVAAVGAILGGIILGRLVDKLSPSAVGKASAVAAGAFQALIGLFPKFSCIIPARFLMTFSAAGLDPVFLAWLSRVTPKSRRGTIFGWSVTAKSIGWAITPLASAGVAVSLNVRAVFLVGPLLFLLLVPVLGFVVRRLQGQVKE